MSLWDEARDLFVQRLHEQGEDRSTVESFLKDKATVEDARHSAVSLREDSDRKYGLNEGRSKGISGKWIRRVMENLDKFTTFGNVAVSAGPESVGLAWFAISQVLSAVQNDYKLYGTFNTALNDITEVMVLVRAYDKIYQGHDVKGDGSIFHELSKGIREVYMSILDFSYAVKKHITGGKRSKLMHAFKDAVGALNRQFEEKTTTIRSQKDKIIQYSEAAFQQKTTDNLGDVSGELVAMQQTMREVYQFHQQSSSEWKEILSELKASKTPSHRDLAVTEYEKNLKLLSPWLDAGTATIATYDEECETGTCTWINKVPAYETWQDAKTSSILCVTGEASSGKSILGAFICKMLNNEMNEDTDNLIQYISPNALSSDEGNDTLERIENTLVRGIYEHALDDPDDELVLQRCNRLFAPPKQAKAKHGSVRTKDTERLVRGRNATGDHTPDLLDIYPGLIEALQKCVVLVIDAIDTLSDTTQEKLAKRLIDLANLSNINVRVLILCRSSSQIRINMTNENVAQISMGDHNGKDIELIIDRGLEIIPGLSSVEKAEIKNAIVQKTGHRIRYVKQVALPFLRTPFQRPVSTWLEDLPDSFNETYRQHLHQLAPNYRRLLRTALVWTLVAEKPPRVDEIMEAYSGVYLDENASEENIADPNLNLYREQIHKAGGPFLDIQNDGFVVLQDAQAVRSFFSLEPVVSIPDERPVCERCRTALQVNDALAISEKQEQLAVAITCMKHLNSRTFQTRHFSQSLEEAKSRAEGKFKSDDGASDKEEIGNDNSLDASDVILEPGDTTVIPGNTKMTPNNSGSDSFSGSNSKGQPGEEVLSKEDAQESLVEDEVDSDESNFSDQDREDFDKLVDDSESWEYDTGYERYEVASWHHHVREAERLWSPSERKGSAEWQVLLNEMERFFLLEPVAFEVWKLVQALYWCEGWEPLLFAAAFGLTSLAELLIDRGAKVMDASPNGLSSLHMATEAPNDLEMLTLLLNHGGDPNFEGQQIPAFHEWFQWGIDIECVDAFLRNNASCKMISRERQWNVLHYFAERGSDRKVLDHLLDNPFNPENRADINGQDDDGETPLHKLLRRQEIPIELLEAFLARGSDVNIDDHNSERPLYEAASYGENAAIKVIIDRVTDVDDDNKWGRTALHVAAWAGQKETVKLLLEHGADVSRRDKHNRTPLLFACLTYTSDISEDSSRQATAELLIEEQIQRGASFHEINACTKRGRTPLREAAGRGFTQVVSLILKQMTTENKEWINKRDERRGRSPLHSAATHARGDVIALLLEHGADPSLRDGKNGTGMTCLELCLDRWIIVGSQRYESAIVNLIDPCVDEAKENKLLLTTAAIHGSVQVLEKLASIGVKLDLPDSYGWTPIQLATQFGHAEAAKFIKRSLIRRALRPMRWTLDVNLDGETILDDGRRVHYQGGLRLSILADHPVPAGLSMYYYEIEVLDPETGEPRDSQTSGDEITAEVAIGFCTSAAKWIDFPGWPPRSIAPKVQSWAYHADDGSFCASDRRKWHPQFGKHYGPGDTVGCGLDVDAQTIFFTRNGVRTDHSFVGFTGRLFPILGLNHKIKLRTNFGTDPNIAFKWTPGDLVEDNTTDQ